VIKLFSGLIKLLLFALILVFAVYNFEIVTLRFGNIYSFQLPLAVILFLVFLLGLVLGSTMTWITGVKYKKHK
jgi:uncharacterized integral membrane protein